MIGSQPSKLPLPEAVCCAPLAMQHPTNDVPRHYPHHFGDSSSFPHLCSPPLATGTDRPLSPLEQKPLSLDLHSCSNPESLHSFPFNTNLGPSIQHLQLRRPQSDFPQRRIHSATLSKQFCFFTSKSSIPRVFWKICWDTSLSIPHTCVAGFPSRTAMCWSHNICNFL